MEVLGQIFAEFLAEFDGATIGAWALATVALLHALMANERLDKVEKDAASKGADDPRDHLSDAGK